MSIRMLGVDHNRASVDIRAIFSFTKREIEDHLEQLKRSMQAEGCIIISTCNRMEIWVNIPDDKDVSLIDQLCKLKGVDPEEYRDFFIERKDQDAVDHLFHLTCGLKSRILAEDQIITQVKDALAMSHGLYQTDSVLEVLFRRAVTAAKRVKTEVTFSRASETAMDQAVEMMESQGINLADKICMVIGNGEMGKLAATTLRRKGADVTVTVRQYRSGEVQIPENCKRIDYGKRMEYLPDCDIVVSATASPNCTIRQPLMDEVVLKKPVIMIDLAVPRDIETSVGEMEQVILYDIDSFKTGHDSKNDAAYEHAELILQEEIAEFYEWLKGRNVIPRIQKIQEEAATDVNLRLHKIIRKTGLEEKDQKKLEKNIHTSSAKVINKMLFGLKEYLDEDTFFQCIRGLEKLYEAE
ncbi:MAG: glutamyl-tRNA reductase [Lachnospiraceae bacterium]|nr:glutamyl-tRNA reductase [Lachnospiraceae bacterium]